jgi:hypothetical protein
VTINPKTLTVEEINEASAKILSDPLLRRFYSWSTDMSRTFFAPPAQPEPAALCWTGNVNCPDCRRKVSEAHCGGAGHVYQRVPAAPVEMPEAVVDAWWGLNSSAEYTALELHEIAKRFGNWWRTHSQPVGITEELRAVLCAAEERATLWRNASFSYPESDFADKIMRNVAAVRERYGRKG